MSVHLIRHQTSETSAGHPGILCRPLVDTRYKRMITLKRLESQLLLGLNAHFPHLLDFLSEDDFRLCGGIDTVGFNGDQNAASDLEEQAGVEPYDTGLV